MDEQKEGLTPVTLFYAYAHEDEQLRDELEKHLSLLQRRGLIASWHDRQIVPGTDWSDSIDQHLKADQMILLLVSPDFLASDYCYSVEMQKALERHRTGEARVIPILLRPVFWEGAPFAHLQVLPTDAKPITTWPNQDEAFANVVAGIDRAIKDLAPRSPSRTLTPRQRTFIVQKLRKEYNKKLARSLRGATMMVLELHERTDVICSSGPRTYGAQKFALLPGTSILQAYDDAESGFLLLGAPGAGKTTLLLDLALALLTRAESNPSHPIPLILNLSDWVSQKPPLATWLIDQLPQVCAGIPTPLDQTLLEQDQWLLLLDGLDEVEPTIRSQCIEAINAYRREYLVPLVVCSRSHKDLTQEARLKLSSVLEIQPLQEREVTEYLKRVGKPMAAVRAVLRANPVLNQLLATPLMLNMVILTYQNKAVKDLPKLGSVEEQQRQIFAHYVEHNVLKQRAVRSDFMPQQICQWLAWLAQQMKQRHLTKFYLEWLQPTWLTTKHAQTTYQAFSGLCFGLLYGLGWLFVGLTGGWVVGLLFGLLFGLLMGLQEKSLRKIDPVEGLMWPWKDRKWPWKSLLQVLFGGLLAGLGFGLLVGRLFGLFAGLVAGLILWLFCLQGSMVSGTLVSKNQRARPDQRIRNSGWNALRCGPLFGLCFGLVVGPLFGLVRGPIGGLCAGLVIGLGFGLVSVLRWGGDAYLKHYILRFVLSRSEVMPWRCDRFLEEATERNLLQRDGRGYSFIHPLFLDYFASPEREVSSDTVRQSPPQLSP